MTEDNAFTKAEEKTIRKIIREESSSMPRRGVLAGAAGLAGLGVGSHVGSQRASAQEAGSGTIGTAENPLEAVYVDQLNNVGESVTVDSVSTDVLHNDGSPVDVTDHLIPNGAVTMYVRSDGSDANAGLSSTNAKETISGALDEAALQGDFTQFLTIDIGTGTFDIPEFTRIPYPLRLRGAGRGSTTLQRSAGATLFVDQAMMFIDQLEISGSQSTTRVGTVSNGSSVAFVDVDITASSGTGVEGVFTLNGAFTYWENCDLDPDGRAMTVRRAQCTSIDTTYDTQNSGSTLAEYREGAGGLITGHTFNGSTAGIGVAVESNSGVEFGSGEWNDFIRAIDARFGGYAKISQSQTENNVDNLTRVRSGGQVDDRSRAPNMTVISIPSMSADPSDGLELFGSQMYYNETDNEMRFYDGTEWRVLDHSAQA